MIFLSKNSSGFAMRLFAFFLVVGGVGMAASAGKAAEAVFSGDGRRIFLLDREQGPGQLYAINLANREKLPFGISDLNGQPILAVDRSNDTTLVCLTPTGLYAYDLEAEETALVCGVPAGGEFQDLAVDPVTGMVALTIFFTAEADDSWQLWVLPPGGREAFATRVRRVSGIRGMAFTEQGEFYFGCDGDLWSGQIYEVGESESPGGVLGAYRCAPLATRETDNATSSQVGVSSIVAVDPWLYVHVSRMGGSGWGNVVRLAMPAGEVTPEGNPAYPFTVFEHAAAYQKALASLVDLGENGSFAYLAVSPDGRTVYFQAAPAGGEIQDWLVIDHGAPQALTLAAP
jgi:hypothetical protein